MPGLLHVIHDLIPSGAATQLRLLARGEEVAVASLRRPGPFASRFSDAGIPVVWTAKRFAVDPFALVALSRLAKERRVDVIQSWDNESAELCRRLKRSLGVRWMHVHRGGRMANLRGVDAVIAPDSVLAGAAGAATTAPVTVVPNAFDPSLAPAGEGERRAAREQLRHAGWDVGDETPVILCVTRIDDAVATKEITWASDLVRVVRPGLRLLVAGEGARRRQCERFAAKATERGTVQWLGAGNDLGPLYAAADVVWVGRGDGAAPTPALEAMAAGKPVVMADGPGRDALLPCDTSPEGLACRVPWNDRAAWARATKRLLTEPGLAAELGAAGARRVRDVHGVEVAVAAHQAALEIARG